MVGTPSSGKRREPIPKGADAEAELKRLRRLQRRKERREAKRVKEAVELYGGEPEADLGGDAITGLKSAMPIDRLPTTEELKKDLMGAFHALGGMSGFVAWGQRYPKEFYALWSKYCLPAVSDGGGDGSGDDGSSLEAMLRKLDEREAQNTQH